MVGAANPDVSVPTDVVLENMLKQVHGVDPDTVETANLTGVSPRLLQKAQVEREEARKKERDLLQQKSELQNEMLGSLFSGATQRATAGNPLLERALSYAFTARQSDVRPYLPKPWLECNLFVRMIPLALLGREGTLELPLMPVFDSFLSLHSPCPGGEEREGRATIHRSLCHDRGRYDGTGPLWRPGSG